MKKFIWLIFVLLMVGLSSAAIVTNTGFFGNFEINTFNTSNSIEDVSLTANTANNLYLKIPKYSNVTYFNLNISSNDSLTNLRFEVGEPDGSFEYNHSIEDFDDSINYFVVIEADSVDESKFNSVSDVRLEKINNNQWLFWSKLSATDYEINRARVIRLLVGGTSGGGATIGDPWFDNISVTGGTAIYTNDSRDIGKFGIWVNTWGTQGGSSCSSVMSGSANHTTNNADVSSWSIVCSAGGGFSQWELPSSTILNQYGGVGCQSELDTDKTADQKNNPTGATLSAGSGGSGLESSGSAIIVSSANFTFTLSGSCASKSGNTHNWVEDYGLPKFTQFPNISFGFNHTQNITQPFNDFSSYLNTCTEDSTGHCIVPLTFNSSSSGILTADISSTLNYSLQYNYTFNDNIIESDETDFNLIVFGNESILADFFYNNSIRNSTRTVGTQNTSFSSTIDIDILTTALNETNITHYWNITLLSNESNTTIENQTVSKMLLYNKPNCSPVAINFTLFNETGGNNITGTVNSYFKVWRNTESLFREFNFSLSGSDEYDICIFPAFANYTINSQTEYSSTGFSTKLYYLVNNVISNVTSHIKLFLGEGTTQVKFNVKDTENTVQPNVIIKVLTYDIGTDTATTSEILQTDSDGNAYGQIILNTQYYKFILEKDGAIVLETNPTIIDATTKGFIIDLLSDYFDNYNKFQSVTLSNVTFVNATKTFSITYSDPTGDVTEVCMSLERVGGNSAFLTETCTTSSAGTIDIVIPEDTSEKEYLATADLKISGNEFFIDSNYQSFKNRAKTFGASGLFVTFLIIVALVMATLFVPEIGIFATILALFFSKILGIFQISSTLLMGMFILGLILSYKLRRRS